MVWDSPTGSGISTIGIHFSYFLQFDRSTPNLLRTKVGTIDLGSTDPAVSSPNRLIGKYGYGLSHDSSWITYNGFNLLWLSAEYRPAKPSLFAISATTVAIGCSSGRVIFLAFSEHNPLYSV